MSDSTPIPLAEAVELLRHGEVDVQGRLPYSSNATLLVRVCRQGLEAAAVYKPRRGERPLWDFPRGLGRREVAAYELSEALGWGLVPPTVLRDGPLGEGSIQLFVSADPDQHYFTIQDEDRHQDVLRRLCAFDLVANNTDRKSGHLLLAPDGRVWAIDNSLCFHAEFKVRTVIWEFGGEPLPENIGADLEGLVTDGLPDSFEPLLSPIEREATVLRARALLESGRFPSDPTGRRYPWPLV